MATERQILANRRNAQLSTGPRTEEGKSVSRLNALRHGLTGQIDVRTPEEHQSHEDFCEAIIARFAPDGPFELQLAHSIAEDHWRLNRAKTLENNIFAITATFQNSDGDTDSPDLDTALAYARTYIADPSRLNLLSIYERRIHANAARTFKQLRELQTARRAAEVKQQAEAEALRKQALEEECLLAQLAAAEGQTYDPADYPVENGFVFSTAEIRRAVRLADARRLQAQPQSPRRPNALHRAA